MSMEMTQPMQKRKIKKKKSSFFFKRLIIWFLISLVLQFGGLTYLNYWLTGNSTAKVLNIKSNNNKIKDKETFKFNSVGEVSSNTVSYDAKYIAFVDQEGLKIYDIKDKKNIYNMTKDQQKAYDAKSNAQVIYPKGTMFKVAYLKWLPDRNMLLYALEWKNNKNGNVNIDVLRSNVTGSNRMRLAHFTGEPNETSVKNIALSTMTNLINVQLELPNKTTRLYQIGIMWDTKQIEGLNKIGNIAVAQKDGFLYAEVYHGYNNSPRISMMTNNSKFDIFNEENNFRLLGVDSDGKLYLGEQSVTGIKTIYTATVKKETKTYTKVQKIPNAETEVKYKKTTVSYTDAKAENLTKLMDLSTTVQAEDIYINNNGVIIISNPEDENVNLYRNGVEVGNKKVVDGRREILLYNKYIVVLKKTGDLNKNEIVIYNLDVNQKS